MRHLQQRRSRGLALTRASSVALQLPGRRARARVGESSAHGGSCSGGEQGIGGVGFGGSTLGRLGLGAALLLFRLDGAVEALHGALVQKLGRADRLAEDLDDLVVGAEELREGDRHRWWDQVLLLRILRRFDRRLTFY